MNAIPMATPRVSLICRLQPENISGRSRERWDATYVIAALAAFSASDLKKRIDLLGRSPGVGKVFAGLSSLWILKGFDRKIAIELAARLKISVPVAEILVSSGIVDTKAARRFLFADPSLEIHNSSEILDFDLAVDRIIRAIKSNEKVLIFGDYDVDGITSTATMLLLFLSFGAKVNFYLPNRFRDGYGLSEKVVNLAHRSGYNLIVTVDNGISAVNAAKEAKRLGIDLVITDHHLEGELLPEAVAVVDPNRKASSYPFKGLAGVGVAFKIAEKVFSAFGKKLPAKIFELLALGTIADMVPLTGENRAMVRIAFSRLAGKLSLAFRELFSVSRGLPTQLWSSDYAFFVAPLLNAIGRVGDPRDAVRFLISDRRVFARREAPLSSALRGLFRALVGAQRGGEAKAGGLPLLHRDRGDREPYRLLPLRSLWTAGEDPAIRETDRSRRCDRHGELPPGREQCTCRHEEEEEGHSFLRHEQYLLLCILQ